MYISERFRCGTCGKEKDELVKRKDRDLPISCDNCEGEMFRTMAAVAVRTDKGGSRTYIDGMRPASHGFTDWKKIAKLEIDKANAKSTEEKNLISKEIIERKKI